MFDVISYKLSKNYTDQKVAPLSSGMTYKGSKPTVEDLPTTGNKKGDVWTISADGSEWVWSGNAWERLGVDASGKADKTYVDTELAKKADLPDELPQELKVEGVDYPWFMINMSPTGIDAEGNLHLNHSGYNFNSKQYYTWTNKTIPMAASTTNGGVMTAADKVKLNAALTEHQDISGKQDKLTSANAGNSITIIEAGEAHNLPEAYQEVEYLESTGTQFINTGYRTNANTNTEIQFLPTANTGDGWYCLLGYAQTNLVKDSTNNYSFLFRRPDKLLSLTYRNIDTNVISGATINETNKNTVYNNGKSFYLNNKLVYTFSDFTTTATGEAYLFAIHDMTSSRKPANFLYKGKIYSCKITENSVAVRNMIPCYRKSDSAAGMYDTVTKQFYPNAGTGSFAVGPDVFADTKISYTNVNNYQTDAQVTAAISNHNSATDSHSDIRNSVSLKQDKLTAGSNIKIENNVISADAKEIEYIELSGWADDGEWHDGGTISEAQGNILTANEMNYIWLNDMHRLDFRYRQDSNNLATYSSNDGEKCHVVEIKLSDRSWRYKHVLLQTKITFPTEDGDYKLHVSNGVISWIKLD